MSKDAKGETRLLSEFEMRPSLSIFAHAEPKWAAIGMDIWASDERLLRSDRGRIWVADDIVFRAEKPFAAVPIPSLFLIDHDPAKALLRSLWHSGIRIEEIDGGVGQLGAIQAHLQDMRTLVFKLEQKD